MIDKNHVKKILVGLIMLFAVAIGITMIVAIFMGNEEIPVATQDGPKRVIPKISVSNDKLPTKFPADIPLEKDAIITQNYNAAGPDGVYQATRGFQTSKSLADNLALYSTFLTNNGWKIGQTTNQATYKTIFASKGTQRLEISMTEDPATQNNTITINFSELP